MHCLEVNCMTASAAESNAVIAAVSTFCAASEVEVRIYRHELHPTDPAVHLTHDEAAQGEAERLGELIAVQMETCGLVSCTRWREVATTEEDQGVQR